VAEISAASEEQSSGIDQVNRAVSQMDQVTQRNAALVEEAAAASKAMEQQTQQLVAAIGFFSLQSTASTVAAHITPDPRTSFTRHVGTDHESRLAAA
jgi:predicted transcriptional regulator YheO